MVAETKMQLYVLVKLCLEILMHGKLVKPLWF